jgi:quercetin dioxygenase-like cupin family protein
MSADVRTSAINMPTSLREELACNQFNGQVGSQLLSETDRVRVWSVRLKPGERIGFHRHVLDYFWTVTTAGRTRSRMADGSIIEKEYRPGDIEHYVYGSGEFKIHDLENLGDTEIVFTTVEFLDCANEPLPLHVSCVGDARLGARRDDHERY